MQIFHEKPRSEPSAFNLWNLAKSQLPLGIHPEQYQVSEIAVNTGFRRHLTPFDQIEEMLEFAAEIGNNHKYSAKNAIILNGNCTAPMQ